ncbi:hypothetical protein G3M48_005240 [Beauveria asiatica]|uniref:Uncharacterized protein n=1 Tax=Beauveria asiatica TaxID=1069075 RepID=A0AAW0RRH3_9HYPO
MEVMKSKKNVWPPQETPPPASLKKAEAQEKATAMLQAIHKRMGETEVDGISRKIDIPQKLESLAKTHPADDKYSRSRKEFFQIELNLFYDKYSRMAIPDEMLAAAFPVMLLK